MNCLHRISLHEINGRANRKVVHLIRSVSSFWFFFENKQVSSKESTVDGMAKPRRKTCIIEMPVLTLSLWWDSSFSRKNKEATKWNEAFSFRRWKAQQKKVWEAQQTCNAHYNHIPWQQIWFLDDIESKKAETKDRMRKNASTIQYLFWQRERKKNKTITKTIGDFQCTLEQSLKMKSQKKKTGENNRSNKIAELQRVFLLEIKTVKLIPRTIFEFTANRSTSKCHGSESITWTCSTAVRSDIFHELFEILNKTKIRINISVQQIRKQEFNRCLCLFLKRLKQIRTKCGNFSNESHLYFNLCCNFIILKWN